MDMNGDLLKDEYMWERDSKILKAPFVKFIFEFTSPDWLPSRAIPEGVTSLNHKAFDNSVENQVVIISISAMGGKIFHSSWALFWVQAYMKIP